MAPQKNSCRLATFRRNEGIRQLRAALQWAYDLELIDWVPNVPKAPRGSIPKKMKGRPLSEAEFERFLDAIPAVVGEENADAWRFDAPDDRVVSARVTISGEEYPVELSGPQAATRDRVLAQPTEAHGRQLLARLLDTSWELRGYRGGSAETERQVFAMLVESGAGSPPKGAHVEVCRMRFDGRTNRLSTQLLLSLDGSPRR